MKSKTMNVREIADYTGIDELKLVRVICNRGTLDGVPLPEAINNSPISSRRWLRKEVRLFKHTWLRTRAAQDPGVR